MHTEHHASGHDLLRRQLNAATAGGQVNVDALSELVAATYHRFEQSIAGLDRQSRARMAVAIEERRRGETELRTQAHRFDVALENMSYGLCMYDASHRMVLCNRRYAELYKLPPQLLVPGTPYRDIVAHRVMQGIVKCEKTAEAVERKLAAMEQLPTDAPTSRVDEFEDGRMICVSRQPMADGAWVSTHMDITDREKLNAELQAASQAKSDFLATMSHEIRTPMNGVLGTLELLLDQEQSKTQRMLTLTARDSAVGLLSILNDILDYSKLEAAKVELDVVSFSPEQVIDDVISLFQPMAAAKGLKIATSVASDLPLWLAGDPARLRQILTNLTGNAVKFTPAGGINVRCSAETGDDGRVLTRFDVIDTGIGIAKDAAGRLFKRFSQSDNSTTRKFGGTGLGLAICKQITELMGGRIGVAAAPGGGSQFWFEVPFTLAAPPVISIEDNTDDSVSQPARQLSVLVVDDNRVNRMIVDMMLSKHGHKVSTAVNGREALEAVKHGAFDLVLMDVQMPEMDGPTATRQIRALAGPQRSIRIIALTANAMPGHREEYLGAGMNDYVAKPINAKTLMSMINKSAPASIIGSSEQNPPAKEPSLDLPVIDNLIIASWSEGMDPADIREALSCLPDESARSLHEIKAAIASGDLTEAKRIAHRLKGMANNLGARRLAAIARSIEVDAPTVAVAAAKLGALEVATSETLAGLRLIA
jgi:signal transduction histidine kinase/CheY-like chemotaxis protein/HPt (histidine-containing phosphotransfer) domain-containing protein